MKCILCNKQYAGKVKTGFNIRLNIIAQCEKTDAIMDCRHFHQERYNYHYWSSNEHSQIFRNSQPVTYRRRKIFGFLNQICCTHMVVTQNLVNDKNNDYSKRVLSCVTSSKIHFSPLVLGHYRAENPSLQKKYLTSYSTYECYSFKYVPFKKTICQN